MIKQQNDAAERTKREYAEHARERDRAAQKRAAARQAAPAFEATHGVGGGGTFAAAGAIRELTPRERRDQATGTLIGWIVAAAILWGALENHPGKHWAFYAFGAVIPGLFAAGFLHAVPLLARMIRWSFYTGIILMVIGFAMDR